VARGPPDSEPAEEVLIPDSRAGLTPSDMVECKLASLLHAAPLPVSQLGRAVPGTRGCMTRQPLGDGISASRVQRGN